MKATTAETQRWWLEKHGYKRKIIHDKKNSYTVEVFINDDLKHVMRTSTFDLQDNPEYDEWVNTKLTQLREKMRKKVKEHVESIQTPNS